MLGGGEYIDASAMDAKTKEVLANAKKFWSKSCDLKIYQ